MRHVTLADMSGDHTGEGNWPSVDDPWPDWWPLEWRIQYPGWWVWRGVAGLLYARLMRSSPPRVVRAESPEALRDEIRSELVKIEASAPRVHSPGAV